MNLDITTVSNQTTIDLLFSFLKHKPHASLNTSVWGQFWHPPSGLLSRQVKNLLSSSSKAYVPSALLEQKSAGGQFPWLLTCVVPALVVPSTGLSVVALTVGAGQSRSQ